MPGDEQRRLPLGWAAGEGVLLHDGPGARQQRAGHAWVRADRSAVVECLFSVLADACKPPVIVRPEAQFSGQQLLRVVPLADEQRHDEDASGLDALQHTAELRLLLEEARPDLGEQPARAQFVGVLVGRLG